MGVPLEEKPHRSWQNFLPAFEPNGLRPGYTLGEMRGWLSKQKSLSYPVTTRDFLLQAPRGAMKSSAGHIFLAQALLCAPSLRLLVCSETTKFSNKFVKQFRAQFEFGSDPIYERFHYFFPEFCIEPGDGSVKVFTSPMRSIAVQDETLEAVSMEMQGAQGRRFDLGWFDDCIGKSNTANNEQREKSLETYGALLKLREAGGAGAVVCIGTPWVQPPPGESGDMYWELMKRNDQDPTHPMAVLRQSAWILKPESTHLFPDNLNLLTEDDVEEFLFPSGSRLSFRELMKEARFDVTDFRTQYLVEYVETEENKWTPTFTLEELQARVRPLSFFDSKPVVFTAASVDCANSESLKADKSSICIARIVQHEGKNTAFVLDVITGRWKYSDLAVRIVEAFQKYGVQSAVLERNNVPWQDLQAAIQRNAVLRGYLLPQIQWNLSAPTGIHTRAGISISAKLKRAKGTEILFDNEQLFFAYGPYTESLFHEMVRFKGQRSGTSERSHDDMVDSLGQLVATYLVKDTGEPTELTPEQAEFERQMYVQTLIRGNYNRIFGNPEQAMLSGPVFTPPPDDNTNPFARAGVPGFKKVA